MSFSRLRAATAAGLLATGLVLAGCGAGGSSGAAAAAPASVSEAAQKYEGVNLPTPYQRPSFTLTGTDGQPYDFATATKGRPTLLFFGYTHCPDVCPTTMANIAVALRDVSPAVAQQVRVVFVTTDPARDTPPVLADWLHHFDADLPTPFVGLTGSEQQLQQAQLSAGVPVAQDGGQLHSALLLLYGADDQAHVAFDGGNGPKQMAHDIDLVVAGR